MKPATFYIDGKRIDVELPKPTPYHQTFDCYESLNAIYGLLCRVPAWKWLVVAAAVVVVAQVAGVELR